MSAKRKVCVIRMGLNERKMQILKSIVDEYIDKGEPVGSKHLVEYGKISLSPATIRNEMSELEQMGYLDKPHTSAGRIPSNSAYRIYVEQLMESYRLNLEELKLLNDLTDFKVRKIEELISHAGKVVSEITNCATVALTTTRGDCCISRYDVMKIDDNSFLLVMVMPDNTVKTSHVKVLEYVDEQMCQCIKNALNEHLCNVSLSNVAIPTIIELEKSFGRYMTIVNTVVRAAYNTVCDGTNGSMNIDGLTNLLSYPEFTDVDKVKKIVSLLENDKENIKKMFLPDTDAKTKDAENNKLKLFIGDENKMEELSDTSVMFCSLPLGNGTNAVIGILGPKRMDYKKAVSALKQLADNFENYCDNQLQEPLQ